MDPQKENEFEAEGPVQRQLHSGFFFLSLSCLQLATYLFEVVLRAIKSRMLDRVPRAAVLRLSGYLSERNLKYDEGDINLII